MKYARRWKLSSAQKASLIVLLSRSEYAVENPSAGVTMRLQPLKVVGLLPSLLSVIFLSNNVRAGQVNSQEPTAASEDLRSVAHASCGFQATEVLVVAAPGAPSVIATVKCDEELTILYDEVGFYKVQIGNATQGYISRLSVANSNQQTPVNGGSNDGVVRLGAKGIAPPTCTHCPDPGYTPEARAGKYQGTIILEVVITKDGKATNVRAVGVSNLDKQPVSVPALNRAWVSLEETSIDSVKRWRFKPAYGTDGKPVAVKVPVEIMFRLK